MPSQPTVRENFRQIRSLLLDLLGEYPDASGRVTPVLRVVEELERQVDTLTTKGGGAGRRFRGKAKSYSVDSSGSEEYLAEYRPDDENPFRCPQATYDALARAMAKCDGFVKYEELMKMLARVVKKNDLPPDYQVRLTLRFWAQPDVDLIERARARYRPKKKAGFVEAARKAWRHAGRPA